MTSEKGGSRGEDEQHANTKARLMERDGRQLGFRPPTIQERGRVAHNEQYLAQLGSKKRATYDAQGNELIAGY